MSNKIIDKNEECVTKYFKEIRNNNALSSEREVELATRILEGDEKALHELVEANLKFVVSIAKDYQNQGLLLSDLIEEGNYGLLVAAKRFDPTRGFRFISYAVWWIRQAIMQSLNDNSRTVRLPANVVNKMSQVKKQIEMFEKQFHREPTPNDLDENGDEFKVIKNTKCISLSHLINDEGDELSQVIPDTIFSNPEEKIIETENSLRAELDKTLEILDDREREIVESYFGLTKDSEIGAMTLEAIGERYGLTKERIRQIKEKAIRKLRHNAHFLFDYLGE